MQYKINRCSCAESRFTSHVIALLSLPLGIVSLNWVGRNIPPTDDLHVICNEGDYFVAVCFVSILQFENQPFHDEEGLCRYQGGHLELGVVVSVDRPNANSYKTISLLQQNMVIPNIVIKPTNFS